MENDGRTDALRELCDKARELREAALAYEDLAAKDAAALFASEYGDFAAFDAAARREAFEAFSLHIPRMSRSAFALALEERYALGGEEEKALLPCADTGRYAVTESRFTSLLRDAFPRAELVFCGGFEEACEKTADGETDGCLLPCLDENRRPIARAAQLCEENGLKKSALIFPDDEQPVYALFTKEPLAVSSAGNAEISFYAGGRENAAKELTELCLRLDLRFSFEERANKVRARLTGKNRKNGFLRLLACLRLLYDGASLDGLYE